MVGCNGLQMEPTEELNIEAPQSPSSETVDLDTDLDTDFCDSLLNSVPETVIVCKPEVGGGVQHNPKGLDAKYVSLYDSRDMESAIMPDLDAFDLDCLDLECFLSAPVPLAC
jgi:hypothetical protein